MNAVVNNYEYHELIEELTEKKFFGEITFYFQGGSIESSRISERNTKSEIRDRMQAKKYCKPVGSMPRSAGKTV